VDDMSVYNDARRSGVEVVERFIEEVLGYVETKDT
jgi:hypothetical protein